MPPERTTMTDTKPSIGGIYQDANGNVGILTKYAYNGSGYVCSGVDLMTGHDWQEVNPQMVAPSIDDWVRIRHSDLTTDRSWGMIHYAKSS